MGGRLYQTQRTLNPYDGLAESVITSAKMFWGDAAMVTYSLMTNSGTASTWTVQGFLGTDTDGFSTTIPEASTFWYTLRAATAQGLYSADTIPKWARVLRVPSNSSMTMYFTVFSGP